MNTSTSNKFKVFSFVFTIIMILYHAQWDFLSNTPYVYRLSTITEKGLDHLAGIAMAYFFMTSGFMLYNNLTSENVGSKLKRRVKNLLIPFILWNMIYMPLKIIFMHQTINGILDLVYHFSFAPYAGPLWYVFAVFILSLLSPFIIRIRNRSNACFCFCICILLATSLYLYGYNEFNLMGYSEDTHIIMWLSRLCRYMPAYIVGGGTWNIS